MVSLCGPRDVVRDRLAAFADAGVGTLVLSPMAWDLSGPPAAAACGRRARRLSVSPPAPERRSRSGALGPAAGRPLRCFLGAFGDAGHAFPMLALGAELARRGHEVTFETWARWREPVTAHGMRFVAAPEFPVFPTRERPLSPYDAVVAAVGQTRPAVAAAAPGRRRARHPDAGAGARGRARVGAGGDPDPTSVPAERARIPALRPRCEAAAHARRGAVVAGV